MTPPRTPAPASFASEQKAREHLCNHVLTRPEAHDWALILPGYEALVRPEDDDALTTVAGSLFSSEPAAAAVELLEKYQQALRRAIDDALRLDWWWEQRQGKYSEWLGLGLDGVHVVWNAQVIKTGFCPASARRKLGAPPPRADNPLPRRDRRERIRPPPPDSPRRRYELFRTAHYRVSQWYAEAYLEGEVAAAGGEIFVDPLCTPRFGRWQQWLGERPGESLNGGKP